ncbi:uncharacterized protein [Rutidosis leptorrhynchoides]|uniref:uncharacterized protein n=1 Tax=Rutidosis leptorrhynchoides TaxID=125765 RepID=UPI003A99FA65
MVLKVDFEKACDTICRFVSSPDAKWVEIITSIYGVGAGFEVVLFVARVYGITLSMFHKSISNGYLPQNILIRKGIVVWRTDTRTDLGLGHGIGRILDHETLFCWKTCWLKLEMSRYLSLLMVGVGTLHLMVGVLTSWCKLIPRKLNVFMWRMKRNRLPTRINLSSRGLDIQDIRCVLCDWQVETIDHVLFGCDSATALWRKVRIWTDVNMPVYTSWSECFSWYNGWQSSSDAKQRMYVIIAALLWHLWRLKISTLFRDSVMKKSSLFDNIRLSSYNWFCNRGKFNVYLNVWLVNPL